MSKKGRKSIGVSKTPPVNEAARSVGSNRPVKKTTGDGPESLKDLLTLPKGSGRKGKTAEAVSPAAKNSDAGQEKSLAETQVEVSSSVSNLPPSSAEPKPETPVQPRQERKRMELTLTRSKLNKKGSKAVYTNPAIRNGVVLSKTLFAGGTFPDSLTIAGEGFSTLGADEQTKAEARNAKRIAKGLKPKATPAERQALLAQRREKLAAKLAKTDAAAAKLAAKLGSPAGEAQPSA